MANVTPTAKQLIVDEIKAFRSEISQRYTEGMNKAEEEFEQGNLSQSQFDTATSKFQRLKIQSTELLGLIMRIDLDTLLNTDVDSPATKIGIAIKNLQEASQKIQNFLNFLQSIAEVIRIADGIIVAIQTGGIAKI